MLRRDGVLLAREHPALARTVRRMAVDATLTAVLPGVVVATSDLSGPEVVALAVARGLPDAVITGAAAARLTFWPELRVDRVTAANARTRARGALVEVVTERIPAELVVTVQGISVACPSLTALDLGGPGIDRALMSRAASLASMGHALDRTPRRPGNRERRRMLHDSRDEPWSEAERLAHAVLRGAGVTGFRTNHPVSCGGATFYLDIAFPSQMVAIEVDGFRCTAGAASSSRTVGGRRC
ncbi:hypothetical protein GCM10011519_11800 [Marmoricola endophyticus]|uniref:DUF559 domain-containing protein n=1 Tax=Marmoricola endophyticus TaxID=2040280 RepID=A0A917BEQ3_9ACTN|nr:hypothetical protein GCM10011519_11800 [Marmoricola endophyticus]